MTHVFNSRGQKLEGMAFSLPELEKNRFLQLVSTSIDSQLPAPGSSGYEAFRDARDFIGRLVNDGTYDRNDADRAVAYAYRLSSALQPGEQNAMARELDAYLVSKVPDTERSRIRAVILAAR